MREVTFVIHNNEAHGARVEFFRGDNRQVIDIAYIIKTWGGPSDFVESVLKVEAAKTERLQAEDFKAIYKIYEGVELDIEEKEVDDQRWSVIFWMLSDKTWTM